MIENKNQPIIIERVDDIPLIINQLSVMQIQPVLDQVFQPHGNWGGVSLGWTLVVWLTYIISQSDHRMKYVEDWVDAHQRTLSVCTGQPIRPLDFCDDRLSRLLTYLGGDTLWNSFHPCFVDGQVRTYDLKKRIARHDSTTLSSYGRIVAGGLLQLGFSKDRRPDLGQVKVMLSTLDPLGLPVALGVLSGEKADDPLYSPAIKQTRQTLGSGLLHVGDCKMAALETRARIIQDGDGYLCPLPKVLQDDMSSYLKPVRDGEKQLIPIRQENAKGELETIAEGYERRVTQTAILNADTSDERTVVWEETQWFVRSLAYAQTQKKAFQKRMDTAMSELNDLLTPRRGKKRPQTKEAVVEMSKAILAKHKAADFIAVTCQETLVERTIRGYAGKPKRTVQDRQFTLTPVLNQEAFDQHCQTLGCHVYAAGNAELNITEAVLTYRGQNIIENAFGRLKGQPLSINPIFLSRDDHRIGLIRVMVLALSTLSLLQFKVRQEVAERQITLKNMYGRINTQKPTAERVLKTFREINLTIFSNKNQTEYHITPLTDIQKQILTVLNFPLSIYEHLNEIHKYKLYKGS